MRNGTTFSHQPLEVKRVVLMAVFQILHFHSQLKRRLLRLLIITTILRILRKQSAQPSVGRAISKKKCSFLIHRNMLCGIFHTIGRRQKQRRREAVRGGASSSLEATSAVRTALLGRQPGQLCDCVCFSTPLSNTGQSGEM